MFLDILNFPSRAGMIDGEHIVIWAPPRSGMQDDSNKGGFSIMPLAVVDVSYCFRLTDEWYILLHFMNEPWDREPSIFLELKTWDSFLIPQQ